MYDAFVTDILLTFKIGTIWPQQQQPVNMNRTVNIDVIGSRRVSDCVCARDANVVTGLYYRLIHEGL